MKPYVYVPYPKCVYRGTPGLPEVRTVQNEAEHREAAQEGWTTAGEFYGYEDAGPAFPDLVVEKPKGRKTK